LSKQEWSSFATGEGEAGYRTSLLPSLIDSNVIVMDCDGTLVEIAHSYDEAIYTTVDLIFQSITSRRPDREALVEAAFELRKSGGFNNDWDTVYAILIGLLSGLSDAALEKLVKHLRSAGDGPLTLRALLGSGCASEGYDDREVMEGLRDVVSYADDGGTRSVDDGLEKLYKGTDKLELLKELKSFLRFPGMPADSLIAGLFDELYLGSSLYQRIYGLKPALHLTRGLIDNESLIVRKDTLVYMKRRFTGGLGLTTGRTRLAAEKTIGNILKEFFIGSNALTFSDDLFEEYERRKAAGTNVWPGKPDPYALTRTMGGLRGYRRMIFVGDSMEDLKMCSKVKGFGDSVLFVGVYKHTINPGATVKVFLDNQAAAVLPTINELKELLGD
jgi:phosphoglycolate phosphatase-like HAD superfamily hydrolase